MGCTSRARARRDAGARKSSSVTTAGSKPISAYACTCAAVTTMDPHYPAKTHHWGVTGTECGHTRANPAPDLLMPGRPTRRDRSAAQRLRILA